MNWTKRTLYAAVLTFWLLPATLRRIYKNGFRSLHLVELFTLSDGNHTNKQPLWIHAVSMGELRTAELLLAQITKQSDDIPILLTCTTETARRYARENMQMRPWTLPLDYTTFMRRFIRQHNPRACILLEQELWPNLISECTKAKIPVTVVNGRMTKRSAKRYAQTSWFTAEAFASLSAVTTCDETVAARFSSLGAKSVIAVGNIKYDAVPSQQQIDAGQQLKRQIRRTTDKPVVLLASTRPGEEKLLLPVLQKQLKYCVLIVVPRHPERNEEVAGLLRQHGWQPIHSSKLDDSATFNCLLVDSIGQMVKYTAAADLAFVGGSLLPYGGQNLFEQLALGVPVVMGPYQENVSELTLLANKVGVMFSASDASDAGVLLKQLSLDYAKLRGTTLNFAKTLGGATQSTVKQLAKYWLLD